MDGHCAFCGTEFDWDEEVFSVGRSLVCHSCFTGENAEMCESCHVEGEFCDECGEKFSEGAQHFGDDDMDICLFCFEKKYPSGDEEYVDESMNPYDGTYDWENDVVSIGDEW